MCNFCAKKILSKSRIICVLSMSRILFDPMSASVTETVVAQQNGYVKPLEPEKHCNGTTTNSKPCDLPSHTESFEVIPLWAAITTYFAFGLLILISYLRELLRRWGWIRYGAKVEGMKVSHGCSLSLCIYSRPRRLLHVHCACYILLSCGLTQQLLHLIWRRKFRRNNSTPGRREPRDLRYADRSNFAVHADFPSFDCDCAYV